MLNKKIPAIFTSGTLTDNKNRTALMGMLEI